MSIFKSFLISCTYLICHFYSNAQSPDGYYINLKGDTTWGKFINFRESGISPSSVSFQATTTSEQISLTPNNCRLLSISHTDNYVAYQGKRLTNPTDYNVGQVDSSSVYDEISAFLHELYNNGNYQLYEFTGRKRSNFFIRSGGGQLQELYYKEFIQNGAVIESQQYRHQLADFFQEIIEKNPDNLGLIQRVAYNSTGLTALFNKMAAGNKVASPRQKYPVQIFVGFGASSNSLAVTAGEGFDFIPLDEAGDYPPETSPLFEIGLKLFFQKSQGRLFLDFRANYFKFNHSHEFIERSGYHTITTFSSGVLSFPIGIGYKIVEMRNINFELSAGISPSFQVNNTEIKVTNSSKTVVSDNPRDFGMAFFGEASIGLFNRLSLFAGYYAPYSITYAANYDVKTSSFRYGARVRIF